MAAHPTISLAYRIDRTGLLAMLDVAMLVVADDCWQRSHLAQLADAARVAMGKPPCTHLAA